MELGETLYVTERREWRGWLKEHHNSKREIWLVFYKQGTGKPRLSYNDSVEEALCFGWIDSTVKRVDEESNAQRFTPRRENSPLSPMNKERARRLIASGEMTQAGRATIKDNLDEPLHIADDILEALKRDEAAWKSFQGFSETYKKIRIGWIEGARSRPQVFQTRLQYFLKMTAQDKQFGMVR